MSGIIGLIFSEPVEIVPQVVALCRETIVESLSPSVATKSSMSFWSEPGIALGAWDAASPPLHPSLISTDEARRFQVVGSGEIYNSGELQKRLALHGHRFESLDSFEHIAHLVQDNFLDWELGLNGKFAFAAWDRRERNLHLGRDRHGMKSLFWTGTQEGIAFSTSLTHLKSMLTRLEESEDPLSGKIRNLFLPSEWTLSTRALRWYLDTTCIPAPETIYSQVSALPPGHRLLWSPGQTPQLQAWWKPTYRPKRILTQKQAREDFSHIFGESLQLHLSNGYLPSIYLSNQVDSILLATQATTLHRERLRTLSIHFDQDSTLKTPPVTRIAQLLGVDHHSLNFSTCPVGSLFPMVRSFEQPFGNPEAWLDWLLAQATNEAEHPAVLTAGGGDFLFARGSHYHLYHLSRFLPKWKYTPRSGARPHHEFSRKFPFSWHDLFLEPGDLFRSRCQTDPNGHIWNHLLTMDYRAAPCLIPAAPKPGIDNYETMLAMDAGYFLPHDLSGRTDSISSGWGIPIRMPWLDNRLFEFINHLQISHKINGAIPHWLVHLSLQASWPEIASAIRHSRKNDGRVQIDRWMAKDLSPIFRDGPLALDSPLNGMLDQGTLRILFEQHRAGLANQARLLWLVLVLDLWLRDKKLAV